MIATTAIKSSTSWTIIGNNIVVILIRASDRLPRKKKEEYYWRIWKDLPGCVQWKFKWKWCSASCSLCKLQIPNWKGMATVKKSRRTVNSILVIVKNKKHAQSPLSSSCGDEPGAPNENFRKNICSEDELRPRIFGTFFVKFLACLPLLGFSVI